MQGHSALAADELPVGAENLNQFAPQIDQRKLGKIEETDTLQLQLSASDKDNNNPVLKFSLLQGPSGLSLGDSGMISWSTDYSDAGDYMVVVAVSDGVKQSQKTLPLVVKNKNRAPQWQSNSLPSVAEGQLFEYRLNAQDPDKQVLGFSLKSAPRGMRIDDDMLIFSPNFKQAGEYTFTVVANDGEDKVPTTMTLMVQDVNRLPVFSSSPLLTIAEAETYRYRLRGDDEDGDKLSYRLLQGPAGMQLENDELLFEPSYEQAGSYTVELELNDGKASVPQSFQLQVMNANRPPVFQMPASESLLAQENEIWRLNILVSDADKDALQLSLLQAPVGLSIDGNQLSWLPDFSQAGEHEVVVQASDAEISVTLPLRIKVLNTNRLPNFDSAAPTAAKETELYDYQVVISDPDQTPLRLTLAQAPEGMQLQDKSLRWQPSYSQAGEHSVELALSDGEASVQQAFVITVANTNRAPIFSQPVSSVLEGEQYEYSIQFSDPDPEDQTVLQLSIIEKPQAMRFDDGRLSWQPDFFSAADYPVVLRVSDGELSTEQAFQLKVLNNNRLPRFTSTPITQAHESLAYEYTLSADDADKETLQYTLQQGPAGMRLDGDSLSWLPGYKQSGKQAVTLTVSDGIDEVEQSFFIEVSNANRAPNIDNISDQQLLLGERLSYQLQASDADGDKVQFKLIHAPEGVSLSKRGKLKYTAKQLLNEATVIVQVDDGELKQRRRFLLSVVAP
ncbi:MAG: hypothetical protein HRU21_05060 [Pseudomonadales bacterium]|nr:hypothetical protein [Pseudomonadales bacterium]